MSERVKSHYDVVIAGARCAGAATGMLLAREGLRVLVVDPARPGSDTLSTHALMRSAVLQLASWGLLDAVRASGAPAIRRTTFHYGDEVIPVDIKPRAGVDALYAPRRTVLDPILQDGARQAGAELRFGHAVVDLVRGAGGRIVGAVIADRERNAIGVGADLVIGADGIRSRVARIVGAEKHYRAESAACSIFGYYEGMPADGYHWHYGEGSAAGIIPTNGAACVFAGASSAWFEDNRARGLEAAYTDILSRVSPALAERVATAGGPPRLRAFAGIPGFLRRSVGPGWALVGDAGFFRDPITAHGISDALREAELLSRAILGRYGHELSSYETERDQRVRGLLDVTDRVASFEWTLPEVMAEHLQLNREMNELMQALEPIPKTRAVLATA